jgi:hypothetical protein
LPSGLKNVEMILLLYYVLLLLFSFLIFRNAYKVWAITKDLTFPICTLIIFYFSLGGAFVLPLDEYIGFKGSQLGFHYLPIFDKLFTVSFDKYYILSCIYYIAFILIFQYGYLITLKKIIVKNKGRVADNKEHILNINPYIVLLLTIGFIAISFIIIKDEIYYAIAHTESIYLVTRSAINPYFTIHQVANELCVLIPFVAFTFAIIKSEKMKIRINNNKLTFILLLLSCIISSLYLAFLGNRRETMSGLIICMLICFNQFKYVNYKKFAIIFSLVFLLFALNIFFRSTYIPIRLNKLLVLEKSNNNLLIEKKEQFGAKEMSSSIIFSNELFYAHFSMYGILKKDVPITYGSSFVYLGTSLIPRAFGVQRPADISDYYYQSVNAIPGQKYTINHVAAWYLNFGIIGIVLGACILAGLFLLAYYFSNFKLNNNNKYLILLKHLMPFLLCAQMVTFITAGPEAYKSLIIEGMIIPIFFLGFCVKKQKL